MKRIYLLMTLLVALTVSAYAQRTANLRPLQLAGTTTSNETYITTGQKFLADAGGNSKYYFIYGIVNAGPDSMMPGDTIMIKTAVGTNLMFRFNVGDRLLSNDTIFVFPVDGSGNQTSTTLTPGTAITSSQTNTNYSWCDSVYAKKGSANTTITDNQTDNRKCTTVEVTFWVTGINTVTGQEDGFIVFPNPASNNLNVKFDFGAGVNTSIQMRDLTGKVVLNRNMGMMYGNQQFSLDISQLSKGLYTAEMTYGDQKLVSKISVQ